MLSFFLKDRKIEELKQSLLRYKKVQDMVMSVQGKKGEITQSRLLVMHNRRQNT